MMKTNPGTLAWRISQLRTQTYSKGGASVCEYVWIHVCVCVLLWVKPVAV